MDTALKQGVSLLLLILCLLVNLSKCDEIMLSKERMVFQTDHGDIHMGFYPDVAPITVAHIRRLGELGAYTGNHFFRVDRGFVAQVAEIIGGRNIKLSEEQMAEARKNVPLEVVEGVKHTRRGILSMARGNDPNSGGSSFSILLGAAPHLDMNYAIFGEVTKGLETLAMMETVETKTEGIFVMPLERIEIRATYMYVVDNPTGLEGSRMSCFEALANLQQRFDQQARQLQLERQKHLPGNLL